MRKLLLLFCFGLLTSLTVWGQSTYGNITATSSTCGTNDSSSTTACVVLPISKSSGSVAISVIGTWAATLQFEVSADNGASWVSISGFPPSSTTGASSTTANGTWQLSGSAYTHVRVRCSAFTSGTAKVTIQQAQPSASAGHGGGGGGITNSAPNLHLMESDGTNAIDSSIVRSTDDYAFPGAINAATSISAGTAPTACGSATGCIAFTAAGTASTQTAGQGSIRLDSGAGEYLVRKQNAAAELRMPLANFGTTFAGMTGARTYTMPDADSTMAAISAKLTDFTGTLAADSFALNATAGSAAPTAVAIPSCAADGSHALTYPSHTLSCTAVSGGGSAATYFSAQSMGGYQSGTLTAVANRLMLAGIIIPSGGLSVGHIVPAVPTGDGANNSAFCIYNSSGTLEAETTAAHISNGVAEIAFNGGTKTITAGKHYIGFTSVGATIQVNQVTANISYYTFQNTAIVTSGGACPASITPPADSYTGSANTIQALLVP